MDVSNHMRQLDIRILLNSDDLFIFGRDTHLNRSEFLQNIEKWSSFIQTHLKSEEIVCSIDLNDADQMALFIASCLNSKKWVSINSRLSKNDILTQLKQIPLKSYISKKDFDFEDYSFVDSKSDYSVHDINYSIDCNRDCLLVFTSGSGGNPKAVVHTFASLVSSAEATNKFYGLSRDDCWLLSLGLFHIAGVMIFVRMLITKAKIELLDLSLQEKIEAKKSNIVSLVPTQVSRLIEANVDMSHLELLIIGGAKTEDWLAAKLKELNIPASLSYGSSETCAQISATRPLDFDGSCGEILDAREVKLSEDSSLMIKGKAVFSGYYSDKKFIDPKKDGYFSSSDIAEIKDNKLYIKGRSDRVFQFGGENISPEIIEKELFKKLTYDLQIVPKQDKEYGNIVCLVIRSISKPDIINVRESFKNLSTLLTPKEVFWHPSASINSKVSINYYVRKVSGFDMLDPLEKL